MADMENMNQIPVTQFGNGGSHEDNPLGGIPQGMGANGKMNLVEEGELKIPDPRPQSEGGFFIVSADPSMKITKTIAEDYNLPKKLVGKSVLKAAESILRKGTGREGDTIEENSINIDLSNFLDAHEELTAMAEAKEEGKFIEELAKLEEKYPEYMQALMGAPEPSMGETPMDPSMQGQQGPSPEEQAMMEQEMMAQQGGMPPGAMPMGAPGMDPAMMEGMPPEAMGMPMPYDNGGKMGPKRDVWSNNPRKKAMYDLDSRLNVTTERSNNYNPKAAKDIENVISGYDNKMSIPFSINYNPTYLEDNLERINNTYPYYQNFMEVPFRGGRDNKGWEEYEKLSDKSAGTDLSKIYDRDRYPNINKKGGNMYRPRGPGDPPKKTPFQEYVSKYPDSASDTLVSTQGDPRDLLVYGPTSQHVDLVNAYDDTYGYNNLFDLQFAQQDYDRLKNTSLSELGMTQAEKDMYLNQLKKDVLAQDKIARNKKYGGKMPKEVLRARAESHMSKETADAYVNNYEYGTNMYAKGGYTVTRSNDRKGKTHKVVRNSDGKTEYYGHEMKNQPKNEKVKKAAEARHKAQGNFGNPFFKAYWDATWEYGGPMEYKKGGNMIKRADGSYSQRGLWDNIRANKGSGKKPTKEMLEQEKKIKGNSMGYGGDMYEYGSTMGNMYFPGGVMDLPNTFISNSPLSTENLINQAKTLNDIGLSEEEKKFDPANQFSYQKSLGTAVGQALPVAANLAMGLFAPPKDYSGIMGRLDPVELERQQLGQRGVQLDQSFAQAQAAMEAAGGPGYMSNIGRLQQNRDQATQQALTDIENTNTQIANLEEKLNLEVQKGNLTAAQAELQLNEAAETAKAAMVGEGIQQIEDIATAGEQNKLGMMYNQMYAPNYKFDYQGNPFAGMFKKDQQTS
jgi:hypothetical protein